MKPWISLALLALAIFSASIFFKYVLRVPYDAVHAIFVGAVIGLAWPWPLLRTRRRSMTGSR